MKHLDLFSGIGGFALAASWVWGDEHEIVSFVEIDPFCQKVLKNHWPDVPIISDIRDVTNETIMADTKGVNRWNEQKNIANGTGRESRSELTESCIDAGKIRQPNKTIDLLTGGFPCQPFSCAGKRRSKEDDRYLWPEMLRIIREVRPTWIIGENVAGIINLALDQVLSDLEASGYETQAFIIPACAVDASHRRDRVWIVANRHSGRPQKSRTKQQASRIRQLLENQRPDKKDVGNSKELHINDNRNKQKESRTQFPKLRNTDCKNYVADSTGKRLEGATGQGLQRRGIRPTKQGGWFPESRLGGMVDGVSEWMDEPDEIPRVATGVPNRVNRLKSLGNAIVPQCVMPIMQAIKEIECLDYHQLKEH